MIINEILEKAGARKRRKRVGRGEGSGSGKTSGRGAKGAGQRAGWKQRLLNEGGAFPLFRRVAKRGFNNSEFEVRYQVVNVSSLAERFAAGDHVTAATLVEKALISDVKSPVKILGDGEIGIKLTVEAQRFSKEAARKLEASGCTIKRLGPQPKKKFVKRPAAAAAPVAQAGGKKKKSVEESSD